MRYKKIRSTKPIPDLPNLNLLLKKINVNQDDWDLLLVGDGSGTVWQNAMGWASTLIFRNGNRRLFRGSCNAGSNNVAEMIAYVHPLLWLTSNKTPLDLSRPEAYQVHVVTDSLYVVQGINRTIIPNSNYMLWNALWASEGYNLKLIAHHVHKDVLALNRLAHNEANAARKQEQKLIFEERTKNKKRFKKS